MAWLKVHTDILGDPKLQRGVRAGLKGLELVPWLLIFAKQANDDGRLSIGDHAATGEDIAPLIPGARAHHVDACLTSCLAIGVLEQGDDGVPFFPNWARRQGRPADMPERTRERMRKSRERRNAALAGSGDVTPIPSVTVLSGSGDVTPIPPVTVRRVRRVTVPQTEETEEKERNTRAHTPDTNGSDPWPISRPE
jgi:hypothetical protein